MRQVHAARHARRADARPDGRVAPRYLATHAQDRHLRDAQPARGALPLDPCRRHDGAPGTDQVGAGAGDGLPAVDGVGRDGGAPREALERDPRRVLEGDEVKVALVRLGLLAALLAASEVAGRAANPLLAVPPSAVIPALRDLLLLRSYPALSASLLLTVREIGAAYALAVGAGLGCGFMLGMHPVLGRARGPMIPALYLVPAGRCDRSPLLCFA